MARNQLKRVSKRSFNSAEADEFERSWLTLADIHILGRAYTPPSSELNLSNSGTRSSAKSGHTVDRRAQVELNWEPV
jgi:tetratricopeptide repeat protein 21B